MPETLRDILGLNTPEALARGEHIEDQIDVAQALYDLRQAAGLTQRQLAQRVGTSHSVISRLEAADYEGHSMAMLRKIGKALGKRVMVTFVDAEQAAEPEEPAVAA